MDDSRIEAWVESRIVSRIETRMGRLEVDCEQAKSEIQYLRKKLESIERDAWNAGRRRLHASLYIFGIALLGWLYAQSQGWI
jgi:hypothetical protein